MGNDWQVLKRELEDYAEEKGVPIIRGRNGSSFSRRQPWQSPTACWK